MTAKRIADTETRPRPTAEDGLPARAAAPNRPAPPTPPALTYGSWMELGLAARQLTAASQPREPAAARGSRRR